MLDIKNIKKDVDNFNLAMKNRRQEIDITQLLENDKKRLDLLRDTEELKNQRNTVSEEIGRLKKSKIDAAEKIILMKVVSDKISQCDELLRNLETSITDFMLTIPNIPHSSVAIGSDESKNIEIRSWGVPETKSFTPLNHWDIGERLGIIDFERAAKISGARFSLMKGSGARLERALMNFMLDHNGAAGFTEIFPPILVNRKAMTGTGQLPKFEADLFKVAGRLPNDISIPETLAANILSKQLAGRLPKETEYFLIPTAEVPVTNIHADEILNQDDLPIYYTAYTPCFRREAGAYGKDTRGLIRQHQFNKVELVKFVNPDTSYDELETLTNVAEDILIQLGLPYRVVALCTGDLGFSSAKTYDLEVWMAGQNCYREISSCSNFEDFQARRANIRYRSKDKKGTEYVHTLNGSGLAIGRTVAAIIENYQQSDGSIIVPEALRSYMNLELIK
jgi:seryl-tRNA synthetase